MVTLSSHGTKHCLPEPFPPTRPSPHGNQAASPSLCISSALSIGQQIVQRGREKASEQALWQRPAGDLSPVVHVSGQTQLLVMLPRPCLSTHHYPPHRLAAWLRVTLQWQMELPALVQGHAAMEPGTSHIHPVLREVATPTRCPLGSPETANSAAEDIKFGTPSLGTYPTLWCADGRVW